MRLKSLGLVLIALGAGIVFTLIFPAWLMVLLIGIGMIVLGFMICR